EQGYTVANGHKRIVIVDPQGKAHNPARLLSVKAKDVRARLSDIDIARLPHVQGITGPKRTLANETTRSPAEKAAPAVSPDRPAAEAAERSRATFEHIADTRRRALQRRQQEEFRELADRQSHRLAFTKKHLLEHYGLPKRKEALIALNQQIKQA